MKTTIKTGLLFICMCIFFSACGLLDSNTPTTKITAQEKSLNDNRITEASVDLVVDAQLTGTDNKTELIITVILCAAVLLPLIVGLYIDFKLSKILESSARI